MISGRIRSRELPSIFPKLSPVVERLVLYPGSGTSRIDCPAEQWLVELDAIVDNRLAAVALRAAREGNIHLPGEAMRRLRASAFGLVSAAQAAIKATAPVLAEFERRGIDSLVIKGPGIARLYRWSVERPYSDVDLLVRPSQFWVALDVVRELGFRERPVDVSPREFMNRYCREGMNLFKPSGESLDVHHHITPWNWSGALSFNRLAEERAEIDLGGIRAWCISPRHNALVAALHVVSDKDLPGRTLHIWRDLVVLNEAVPEELLQEAATEARLDGWLYWIRSCIPSARQGQTLRESQDPLVPIPKVWRLKRLVRREPRESAVFGKAWRIPLVNMVMQLVGTAIPERRYLVGRFGNVRRVRVVWLGTVLRRGARRMCAGW